MIRGILSSLELEGMHVEAAEEAAGSRRGTLTYHWRGPGTRRLQGGDISEVEHEKDAPKVFSRGQGRQRGATWGWGCRQGASFYSGDNEGDALQSPPHGWVAFLIASAARGSTSSSSHHPRLKSAKVAKSLVGFPAHQLSYEEYPFLEGLHALSANAKAFYNNVLSFERDIFEVCQITCILSRRLFSLGSWALRSSPKGKLFLKLFWCIFWSGRSRGGHGEHRCHGGLVWQGDWGSFEGEGPPEACAYCQYYKIAHGCPS